GLSAAGCLNSNSVNPRLHSVDISNRTDKLVEFMLLVRTPETAVFETSTTLQAVGECGGLRSTTRGRTSSS
ncbi:MAG: hypothetical protein J07HX5_01042, partial [halophilic archaeon J07HX5]